MGGAAEPLTEPPMIERHSSPILPLHRQARPTPYFTIHAHPARPRCPCPRLDLSQSLPHAHRSCTICRVHSPGATARTISLTPDHLLLLTAGGWTSRLMKAPPRAPTPVGVWPLAPFSGLMRIHGLPGRGRRPFPWRRPRPWPPAFVAPCRFTLFNPSSSLLFSNMPVPSLHYCLPCTNFRCRLFPRRAGPFSAHPSI